jgi:hypothetical protein
MNLFANFFSFIRFINKLFIIYYGTMTLFLKNLSIIYVVFIIKFNKFYIFYLKQNLRKLNFAYIDKNMF